jgi:hypothetical protein
MSWNLWTRPNTLGRGFIKDAYFVDNFVVSQIYISA